ncbi:MAG: type II toxin-antitoxin system VapC family toxin [Actinomycetota bacterium]
MIVLDASVAITGLLTVGPARTILAESALSAPHLIDTEVAHVFRRRVRLGQLDPTDAERALLSWQQLAITRLPIVGALDRLWELRENLSAYDATYVVLAEALGVELVTADARLAGAPGPRCAITVIRP